MQKIDGSMEAWRHFYEWVRKQPVWKSMPHGERKRIYDAQADANGTRGKALGVRRIRRILEKHAPGKYEFQEVVVYHE